jgi:hypothetical protein
VQGRNVAAVEVACVRPMFKQNRHYAKVISHIQSRISFVRPNVVLGLAPRKERLRNVPQSCQ